ncbi:hypothetical protein HMI56_005517 [Coelomomyces lativittatus]|nr:hypothetical protein HMI56_005517 [Coelomomyces lativittatus]
MDITSTFWKCLSTYQHERVDLLPPVKPKFPKPITQLKDPYLIQASQISQSIKEIYTFGSEIQKQYLGIDPSHTYTTSEKEAIDIKCALMIAQCRASIQSLELALLNI